MTIEDIAAAVQRVQSVLARRPATGIHDDAPATARLQNGLRVVACHANGTQMPTDMPTELGGSGNEVTPGWLFRAGLASTEAKNLGVNAVVFDSGIMDTLLSRAYIQMISVASKAAEVGADAVDDDLKKVLEAVPSAIAAKVPDKKEEVQKEEPEEVEEDHAEEDGMAGLGALFG